MAYSSVSHLGFCTLGIFALNPNGIAGSVIQQINHGISTGMLFLIVGVIYERRHTREIKEYGGLAHVMPNYAFIFAFAMLSSAGLPLLNGFVGEFTILQGAFEANRIWAAFARHRHHSWRRVSALALPANHAWTGDQPEEPEAARSERPRVGCVRCR